MLRYAVCSIIEYYVSSDNTLERHSIGVLVETVCTCIYKCLLVHL